MIIEKKFIEKDPTATVETSQDILEQRVTVMKHALATTMKFVVDISTQVILTTIPTLCTGLDCKNFV